MPEIRARRLQFHLSTLILLVVFAGGLLGLHLRPREQILTGPTESVIITKYGFPLTVYHKHSGWIDGRAINWFAPLLNSALVLIPVGVLNELRIRKKCGKDAGYKRFRIHLLPGLIAALLLCWCIVANWRAGKTFTVLFYHDDNETTIVLIQRGWPQRSNWMFSGQSMTTELTILDGNTKLRAITYGIGERYNSNEVEAILKAKCRPQYSFADIARNITACGCIVVGSLIIGECGWRRWLRRKSERADRFV